MVSVVRWVSTPACDIVFLLLIYRGYPLVILLSSLRASVGTRERNDFDYTRIRPNRLSRNLYRAMTGRGNTQTKNYIHPQRFLATNEHTIKSNVSRFSFYFTIAGQYSNGPSYFDPRTSPSLDSVRQIYSSSTPLSSQKATRACFPTKKRKRVSNIKQG